MLFISTSDWVLASNQVDTQYVTAAASGQLKRGPKRTRVCATPFAFRQDSGLSHFSLPSASSCTLPIPLLVFFMGRPPLCARILNNYCQMASDSCVVSPMSLVWAAAAATAQEQHRSSSHILAGRIAGGLFFVFKPNSIPKQDMASNGSCTGLLAFGYSLLARSPVRLPVRFFFSRFSVCCNLCV